MAQSVTHAEKLAVVWMDECVICGITERNVRKRALALGLYLRWCSARKIDALSATHEQVQAFITRVPAGRSSPFAVDKQKDEVKALQGWFRWMHDRNLVKENPTRGLRTVNNSPTKLRDVPKPLHRFLTRENTE